MQEAPLIYVVDDDTRLRNSLGILLRSLGYDVQLCRDATELEEMLNTSRIGCILLDLRLPGTDGLSLLRQLRNEGVETPVIIVSGHADVSSAVGSMKLGAIDVLEKPVEFDLLAEVVKRGIDCDLAIRERQSEQLAIRRRFDALTSREVELLNLIVAGLSNKQIALRLGISRKTVANHRAHLMTKVAASNAADLARLSTIAGLTTTEASDISG